MLDREISPVWHDRFARLIVRNLPNLPEVLALDIHCGTGRGTGELLHRLGAGAKVLAIDPDEGALEMAKTRIRAEWKNRVYFKPGHFDDVTAMADDSYNLVVANLVLGESVDLEPALGEMIRVCKIGGRILATVPLHGTWEEVEDIFAEILRDAGMTAALRRLEALRAIRPTGPQLGKMLRNLGAVEDDYVIEHERFQLLFPSGREFLFAPVIEHGPLQMWKAVIGKDGAPQELFWRLKEAIDAYYAGHVLAVTVQAGLIHVEVAKGTARPGPRLAARFWRHYPELDKLWGGLAVGYARVSDPILPFSDADFSDFDLDIDLDESDPRRRTGALRALRTGRQPVVETPSPEDFGLRFRPRDPGEASDIRPLDAETSGLRARPPGSEASGLRTLSQLRDSEISSVRPAGSFRPVPVAVDEDDFSELNNPDTRSHRTVSPAPRAPEPAPTSEHDEDLSRLAETEDDFSELNDIPLLPPRRQTSGSVRRSSESSATRPIPADLVRGDSESSTRRALEELALRPGDSERSSEFVAPSRRSISSPTTAARRPASAPIAEARRPTSGPIAEARRPEPDAAASGKRPIADAESSGRRPVDAESSGRRPAAEETSVARPLPDAAASGRRPIADAATSGRRPIPELRRPGLSGPTEAAEPEPRPPAPAERTPSAPAAAAAPEIRRPASGARPAAADTSAPRAAAAARPAAPPEAPRPSLPSFRLPERTAASTGTSGLFRPPSFKPPGEDSLPPVKNAFNQNKPPPGAGESQVDDEEEPEEIDELEHVDEIEPDDEPAPVVTAPRPPPPKAPPPRPPSLSPDKKK
ncbi:methyltransferase domain-containing protein [Nannocystis pusilla]|uniref:Methyltransferase domain-containing protein n=1 Tax=Nannocystis pusilla TaxID=889268 RepID=A0ABS7THZ1_9BACT|nr:methyltransferase domain-containing protein [Nannocystis pusilla]